MANVMVRIPLVRFGGDDTPIAWRDWLFTPPGLPFFGLGAKAINVECETHFVHSAGEVTTARHRKTFGGLSDGGG